jgi:hypothetical protein
MLFSFLFLNYKQSGAPGYAGGFSFPLIGFCPGNSVTKAESK